MDQYSDASRLEALTSRIKLDAQTQWDSGLTHYILSVDGQANTAYLIQWVESIGWKLEHAGWVWAPRSYVVFGGIGILDSEIVGNFLFGPPGGPSSVPRRGEAVLGKHRGVARTRFFEAALASSLTSVLADDGILPALLHRGADPGTSFWRS